MQFVLNMLGYELAVALTKKSPGPAVIISDQMNIHVNDVSQMMSYVQTRPGRGGN